MTTRHAGRGARWRGRAGWAVLAVGLALAGCGAPGPPPQPPRPAPPAPSIVPTPPAPVSPLTGRPADLGLSVVAVKVDNVGASWPHTGLAAADVVYVEPIEGGYTRLVAVYQSQTPEVVGPVRSARRTDLDLLAGYGRPTLAFSGAAPQIARLISGSGLVNGSEPARPGAYFRSGGRPAPHNVFVRPRRLPKGSPPRDIGFRFGPVPGEGRPAARNTARYGRATVRADWLPAERRWGLAIDGQPLVGAGGARPSAATVVWQRTRVRPTGVRDGAGNASPFAETVGSGPVTVLRDGMAFDGTWTRPSREAPTSFTGRSGGPLHFAPGPVWVLLLPR